MKSNQIWDLAEQLASTQATIGDNDLQLTIANGSAASGAKITIGTEAVSLFSVESSNSNETLVDVYVRGDDLIAKYQSSEDELDRELYWRVLDVDLPADSFALEMIYSLQTDLLDTQPDPRIVSALKLQSVSYWSAVGDALAGELQWKKQDSAEGSQLITGKLPSGTQLAIAVYPTDLVVMELEETEGETTVTCRLNAEFLEKGVIRRTRMFALCAGDQADEEAIIKVAQTFLDSETPLTT